MLATSALAAEPLSFWLVRRYPWILAPLQVLRQLELERVLLIDLATVLASPYEVDEVDEVGKVDKVEDIVMKNSPDQVDRTAASET